MKNETFIPSYESNIDLKNALKRLINDSQLSPNRYHRIECVYVLVQRICKGRTLKSVAEDLNRSPERIRQMQARTIRYLRHPIYGLKGI